MATTASQLALLALLLAFGQGDEEGFLDNVHGDLYTRYVYRSHDSETDQDIYQGIRIWGRDSERGRFGYLLHGLVTIDVDGRTPDSPFADRSHLWSSNSHGYLYSAYAEMTDLPREVLRRVRVGRQFAYLPETFHVDGATLETATVEGISLRALAGIPVHPYESSTRGDFIGGAGIAYRPTDRIRIGADYVHLQDEVFGGEEEVDDLYYLSGLVRVGAHTRTGATASWIGGRLRRLNARIQSHWEEGGLTGGVRIIYQPHTIRSLALAVSPFYSAVLESRPYYQVLVYAEKELMEHVGVELGGTVRELIDENDEGTYNREFGRLWTTVHSEDLVAEKVDLSFTGEVWLTEMDDVWSVGADIGYRPSKRWRASAGYFYSLYKIDRITLEEKEQINTAFARLTGPLVGAIDFLVGYEMEWDGEPVYHVAETGVRLRF